MSGEPSDEKLWGATRKGDIAAFDLLYARYARRLLGYLTRMATDRQTAEDLLQDVFMQVLEAPANERPYAFAGWLFTVARNRALDLHRKRSRHGKLATAVEQTQPGDADQGPEQHLQRHQQLAQLQTAFAQLPEPHQEVLVLREVSELSYRQIGEVLAIPEGTAKSRVHLAIKALRNLLHPEADHG